LLENFVVSLSNYLLTLSNGNLMIVAFYAGLFVALMTTFGALLAIFSNKMPDWGILLIYTIDRFVPHKHLVKGYEGPEELKDKLRVMWLIVLAVIIHNLPEGLAVGTSIVFDLKTGLVTAIAVGIQDFPEGIVVSLPLATLQKKRLQPILMGVLSGVAEWIMVLVGAFFFTIFHNLLPYGLGLAGGAMLYVTVKEMIPEIYKHEKNELLVTAGFFLGFYVMLFLDSMLG